MKRYSFLLALVLANLVAAQSPSPQSAAPKAPQEIKVAFVISENFEMIDFAGPWEVFQDVMTFPAGTTKRDSNGSHEMPFNLYTVSDTTKPVTTTGGLVVVPSYTFEKAPKPDIVVIGAQSTNSPALMSWLRKLNAEHVTLMSVCTGARKLALSGLIDGKEATTHHEYVDRFQKEYPKVSWQKSKRYVRSTETIYTAGGLTSGIDLALHIVAQRFGDDMAQATADYMEYHSDGWKQADSELATGDAAQQKAPAHAKLSLD